MADMVPDEIKPAERVGGATDDLARELVLAQIAGQRDRLAAGIGDLLHHRAGARLVQVHDRDRGALLREAERAGAAHAGAGGGDDADFVCQTHGRLPSLALCVQPAQHDAVEGVRDARHWGNAAHWRSLRSARQATRLAMRRLSAGGVPASSAPHTTSTGSFTDGRRAHEVEVADRRDAAEIAGRRGADDGVANLLPAAGIARASPRR